MNHGFLHTLLRHLDAIAIALIAIVIGHNSPGATPTYQNSSVRMDSRELTNAPVELLQGEAMVIADLLHKEDRVLIAVVRLLSSKSGVGLVLPCRNLSRPPLIIEVWRSWPRPSF